MGENKSFGQVMSQIGDFLRGLTTRQRFTLGVAAVFIAGTLFVFVRLIRKPEYKPLVSGMKADDARSLADRLAAKNIRSQLSPDGTGISVVPEQLDAARLEVASEGAPRSGRLGFEIFDKTNWSGTEFTEKVNYQRALEGELERTIQTLSEVEAVRVHLVLPEDSIFVEETRDAKAAVIVKLRGGRYSEETHRAISQLVASAVERLRPQDVTVVDADTNRPLDSTAADGGPNPGADLEQQLAQKLVRTLQPVTGANQVRASVRLEYDSSTVEENQETYDPNSAVALTMQRSEEMSAIAGASGVPGTAANVPGSQGARSAAATRTEGPTQSSKSENGTYAINSVVRHIVTPAGRLRRIAAALVVDDAVEVKDENGTRLETRRKRTADELKQIEDIAKAAIGIDATRGDVLVVQNLSFQEPVVEKPQPPTPVERVRTVLTHWSGLLHYVAIALLFGAVYLLLLRPVKNSALTVFRQSTRAGSTKAMASGVADASSKAAVELEGGELQLQMAAPEARRAVALKRELLEKVKAEPAGASRLVQSWIREGGLG